MKKLSLVVCLGLLVGLSKLAWSQDDTHNVSVNGSINSVYSLQFTENGNGLTFGGVNPGGSVYQTVGFSIYNNHGVPWSITLSANPLTRDGGTEQLQPSALQYNISGGGNGTYNPAGATLANVPTSPTNIYSSGAGENVVNGLAFGLGVQFNAPTNARTGSYSTSLNIVLSDSI